MITLALVLRHSIIHSIIHSVENCCNLQSWSIRCRARTSLPNHKSEANCHNVSFFQVLFSVCDRKHSRDESLFLFFLGFLRYQILAYPLRKKIPGDAATCGKILTKSKLENWLLGRTKVFLKYYHVEELARLLELHRIKVVTLQTGWFMFHARVCYFCDKVSSAVLKLLSFFAIVSSPRFVQNFSCENEIDLHENEFVGETHFHRNGSARSH